MTQCRKMTPDSIRARLLVARSVLRSDLRRLFFGARFDGVSSLVSADAAVALVWSPRLDMARPDSYENQETLTGTVRFEHRGVIQCDTQV